MPRALKGPIGLIRRALLRVMDPDRWARERWYEGTYYEFALDARREGFLACARFLHINRPITGYYLEFGCYEGRTMRLAWDAFKYVVDLDYVAFDSFEGLPDIEPIDQQEIWKKGTLATSERDFVDVVVDHGMPRAKLRTVKGFYAHSLSEEVKERLLPGRAAVIYVDCDLYTSTVPVLEFIKDFLQVGTIIVFDDWFCFYGDPARGERLAFAEFRARYPELRFEPFFSNAELQGFIYLGQA